MSANPNMGWWEYSEDNLDKISKKWVGDFKLPPEYLSDS